MTKPILRSHIANLTVGLAASIMAAAPAVGAPIRVLFPDVQHAAPPLVLADYHNDTDKEATKLDKQSTRKLVKQINGAAEFCENVVPVMRIDCLAERYGKIAKSMSNKDDMKVVKAIMTKASRDLQRIAQANADPSAKKVRPRVGSGLSRQRASRPLTSVRPARLATAQRQAQAVIQEARTTLLRSGENSGKRQVYYASIAQAVDSNKVLLRSA